MTGTQKHYFKKGEQKKMASTNKTPNYNLPQFLGTDKASWLGDINPAMQKIDEQMKLNDTNASQAIAGAENAVNIATSSNTIATNAMSEFDKNESYSTVLNMEYFTNTSGSLTINTLFNKRLLNSYGWLELKPMTVPKDALIFTTNVKPKSTRTVFNYAWLRVISQSNGFYFRSIDVRWEPDGKVYLDYSLDVPTDATTQELIVQSMLYCTEWGL